MIRLHCAYPVRISERIAVNVTRAQQQQQLHTKISAARCVVRGTTPVRNLVQLQKRAQTVSPLQRLNQSSDRKCSSHGT